MTEDQEREYASAYQLRQNGDLHGAASVLRKLSGELPQSLAVALVLGKTYSDLGELDHALPWFLKAVDLKPSTELASLALFHCLWEMDRTDDAFDEMRRFLKDNDSDEYKQIWEGLNKAKGDEYKQILEGLNKGKRPKN